MRTNLIWLSLLLLTLFSCSKEDDWQTVSISGSYTNTPDLTAGFHSVTTPAGVLQLPKKYIVSGSDNIVGNIDATKSFITMNNISLNPVTSAFDLVFDIVLFDGKGDKVEFSGTGQSYFNNTGLSWQHYSGGTGKYEGISGWLNTSIALNPDNGVLTITVIEGEATYKK